MERRHRSFATVLLGVIVVVAFVLYMIAYSVPFTHTAVVTTFGKITDVRSEPGLCFKWPWPIQQKELFDNRLRVHESKLEQLYTADEQAILVTIYTAWRIAPSREAMIKFRKEVQGIENAPAKLTGLAHDAMATVIGQSDFEHFVSTDPKRMKFSQIEDELKEMIATQAMNNYGIEVRTVGIKRLELPEDATTKVFARMEAERTQLAKRYLAQGKSQAAQIRARANQLASDIKTRASAKALAIRGEGDAEAAEYYKIFSENPELHNFIKQLEALKEILPKRTTLFLDSQQIAPFELIGPRTIDWLMRQVPATESGKQPTEDKTSK